MFYVQKGAKPVKEGPEEVGKSTGRGSCRPSCWTRGSPGPW